MSRGVNIFNKNYQEIVADLCACEPESGWQCAEDKKNGDVEEA